MIKKLNFISENINYHQKGNAYPEFDTTIRKSDGINFLYDDFIGLVNNSSALCFKEGRLSTTVGNLRKNFAEIDVQRYPRDGVSINYTENDYIDQYRDFKLFFKECIGEPILNPLLSYPDMKTKYSTGIIDLRHQADLITAKKIQQLQEYGTDPSDARL